MVLAVTNLLTVKTCVILSARMTQSIMIRMIGLDQNPAASFASTRPAGDLRKQLKCTLGRPKIRQRETGIHRHHANQRDVWEIVAFGQHLCANEHVEPAGAEIQQRFLKLAAARSRVAVNACYAQIRKQIAQHLFDLFGAFTHVIDIVLATARTLRRRRLAVVAVMANDYSFAAMVS